MEYGFTDYSEYFIDMNIFSSTMMFTSESISTTSDAGAATQEDQETIDALHTTHGILMWTGMALLVPIGIFGSKFKTLFGDNWYNLHVISQRLAIFLLLAGFIISIIMVDIDEESEHFGEDNQPHKIGGLIVFILMFLQGIGGTIRPAAPVAAFGDDQPIIKTKRRVFWERGHRVMGYIIYLYGQVIVFAGLGALEQDELAYAHIGWVGLVIVTYLVMLCLCNGDKKGKAYFGGDEQEVDMTTKLTADGNKKEYDAI